MSMGDELEVDEALDPALAARFALDGRAGPAQRVSSQHAAMLVQGALDAAGTGGMSDAWRAARSSPWKAAGMAGAGLLLAGAAAALYVRTASPQAPPTSSMQTAPAVKTTSQAASTSEASPTVSEASAAVLDDMLERANRLRAKGDYVGAERLYARVFQEHPGSLAGYVARVAAASIRLDHLADAQGARALLQGALRERPGGVLDLEVRAGLSKAERALGDQGAERAALQALVKAHPASLAAERARERLRELDDGSGAQMR